MPKSYIGRPQKGKIREEDHKRTFWENCKTSWYRNIIHDIQPCFEDQRNSCSLPFASLLFLLNLRGAPHLSHEINICWKSMEVSRRYGVLVTPVSDIGCSWKGREGRRTHKHVVIEWEDKLKIFVSLDFTLFLEIKIQEARLRPLHWALVCYNNLKKIRAWSPKSGCEN